MSDKSSCRTNLLSDEPAEKDAFGSHKKIATAISEMISSAAGGFTIGVEGVWGSGKSTVVKLLRGNLSTHKQTCVITFDAWVHEGDPLRRSFLERVIQSLMQRDWVDRKAWGGTLKKLARRRTSVTRTTTPTLTGEGVAFSISLLFVPLGIAVLEGGIESIGRPEITPGPLIAAGVICVLLPLLLIPIMMIRAVCAGKPPTAYLRLIANQIVEKERSTSESDPEPTSVEFVDYFSSLMEEALKPPNNRIVLVIDNLDRVPEDFARTVWSALRAFLEASDSAKPAWFNRLWIVVPYARESLQGNVQPGNDTFASFIDKVFQARFYLSTPVLSDWKSHLFDLLHLAFPDHERDSGEFHRVYNAINAGSSGIKNPTPRELVLVVNDIGSLHRQWQDTVDLSHMAYYALLRRSADNILEMLTSGAKPTPSESDLLGPNLADNTAALYFNCDVKDARQILLRRPLEEILARGNGKELADFATLHRSLNTTLESLLPSILENWLASTPNNIALAALCLLKGEAMLGAATGERDSIERELRRNARQVQKWSSTQEVCSGLIELLKLRPDKPYVLALKNALVYGIELIPAGGAQMTDARRAQQLVPYVTFLKEVRKSGLWDFIADTPVIPGAAAEWLVVTQIVGDSDPSRDLSVVLPLNCTTDDISAALQAAVTNHQLEINHVLAVRLAKQRKEALRLTEIASAILTVYAASADIPERELCMLAELGLACEWANGSHLQPMDLATKQGRLPHHFHMAFTRSEHTAAAYSFLLFMEVNPGLVIQAGWQHSQTGVTEIRNFLNSPDSHPKLLDAIVEIIYRGDPESNVNLLLSQWASAGESRPLVRRCFRGLAKKGGLRGKLTQAQLIEMWEGLDEEELRSKERPALLTQVIASIDDAGQMREYFLSQNFTVGQARLLIATTSAHPTVDADLVKWTQTALDKIPPEQWVSDLENAGPLHQLVTVLVEQGATLALGVAYLDSLVGFAAKMARGNVTNKFTAQEWDRFLSVLSASLRVRFTERVLDDLLQLRGKILDQVFDALGDKLIDIGVLTRKDEVVSNLFSPLVEQRQVRGINWLCKVFDTNAGSLDGFKNQESIDEFRIRIREALQNPANGDFDIAMAELAKHWLKDGPASA